MSNISNINIYSYTVPATIIAISSSLPKISEIVNTLGGIYSIFPINTSKIFAKDLLFSNNIEITGRYPQFEVSVDYLEIIDFNKCTYCGKCYKACPEKCISEELEIDFNKCTYCGKCEEVCPEKAINLNLLKTNVLKASFILTDDKDILNNFANTPGVYNFDEINQVLSMTGEFEVEENIRHSPEICQYSGKLHYGCKRCIDSCEYNACYVKEDGEICIDYLLCESCGKCVSVCPTGAMQYLLWDDKTFIGFFKDKNVANKSLVFGTKDEIRKFLWKVEGKNLEFFEIDPRYFNLLNYLFLFSIGTSKVIVLNEKLKNSDELLFANKLIHYLFNYKNFIEFNDNISGIEDIKTNPLQNFYFNYTFDTRRKKLSSILAFLYENSSKKDVLIEEDYLNIFGEVVVDEIKCSLCLACVNHCKIGALTANNLKYSLNHTPSICIQCKICEKVCPEKAIKLEPGLLLSDTFFENKELYRDEPMVCPSCKKEFGSKKSFETVKEKLINAGLFEEKGAYLHYCDECRVLKLYNLK